MNTPLIVVLPYHTKDKDLAAALLNWIHELGSVEDHSCILIADSAVPPEDRKAMLANAGRSFSFAGSVVAECGKIGHAPNHMFLTAARYIKLNCKLPWLWLEPDAVPLRSTWLNELADEYAQSPRKFLGPLIESDQPGLPKVHLPGTAVYSQDALDVYDKVKSLRTANVAWDMEASSEAVPRAQHTSLISHTWGTPESAPKFVTKIPEIPAPHTYTLDFIKPSACIFHRVKNGSLIPLLREVRKNAVPAKAGGLSGFVKNVGQAVMR